MAAHNKTGLRLLVATALSRNFTAGGHRPSRLLLAMYALNGLPE